MYVYCRQGWLEYKKKIIQLNDIKVDHTRFIQTSKLTGNTCIAEPREPRRGGEGGKEEMPIKCQGWTTGGENWSKLCSLVERVSILALFLEGEMYLVLFDQNNQITEISKQVKLVCS